MNDPKSDLKPDPKPADLGIEDVLDVMNFCIDSVEELASARTSDGKISLLAWAKLVITEAPEAFAAVKGVSQIPLELENLNDDEKKQLLDKSLQLVSSVTQLIGKKS